MQTRKHSKCTRHTEWKQEILLQPAIASKVDFVENYFKNKDMDMSKEHAQLAAAVTVTRPGAQSSLPTLEEVLHFKNNHKEMVK